MPYEWRPARRDATLAGDRSAIPIGEWRLAARRPSLGADRLAVEDLPGAVDLAPAVAGDPERRGAHRLAIGTRRAGELGLQLLGDDGGPGVAGLGEREDLALEAHEA